MLGFRLLGPLEVDRDGELVKVGGLRRRAVLAMLLLEAGRVVSVDRLIDGVWGEKPPETAATVVHGHISHLRRALGNVIVTRPPGYLLDVDRESVDVTRFEAQLETARTALGSGDHAAARAALDDALALWRGPPLADLTDAPFAAAALPRLEELGVSAREERMEAELAAGFGEELVPALKALVAENPLRERPRAQLMLALYRAGRQAEALEAYDAARRGFAQELGIEPGEPLRRLHEAILREDPDLGRRRARPRPSTPRSGRRRVVLAIGAAAAAGALALAIAGGDSDRAKAPALRGSGLVRIEPDGLRVAAAVRLDGTPTSVAAARGRAWVIDADDQTVTEVSAAGRRVRTFSSGASPTDLAVAGDDLWLAEGRTGRTQSLGPQTATLAHLPGPLHAVRARVALPRSPEAAAVVEDGRVAVSERAVWVIAGDGALVQVDRLSDEVVRVRRLAARAVAAAGRRAWVLTADGTVVPLDDRGTTGAPIDVPGTATSLAVGGGAVWVRDPGVGMVTRIDPAGAGGRRSTAVGAGPGGLAYGHGALWAADGARGRVVRIDPITGQVTGEVAVGGTPRDIAVSASGIWVSVGARSSAATTACGRTVQGGEAADVIMVVDLPLRRSKRSPTAAMAEAIAYVVKRHGYRAGRLRVGYRLCDDSTAQSASWDAAKCAANARAYAAEPRVVIEVGPYNSGCAERQIPVASEAPDGPLAMVSPTNTAPHLTRDVRPGQRRAYTRIIARDDQQAPAMVSELRRRGQGTVFVLDDARGSPTLGLEQASYFVAAARSGGLQVVGRASWAGGGKLAALVRRVAHSGADVVYVSGELDRGAGSVVRALRRALPANVTLAGPDLLLPVASLFETAGEAARGVLISTTVLPIEGMPQRGRALAAELARDQRVARIHPAAVYGAQAAEVALDAIARSDGSRGSVRRALLTTKLADAPLGRIAFDTRGDLRGARVALLRTRRGGGSRDLLSTDGAELLGLHP